MNILKDLISESADGALGIERVLQAAGYNITFNELYLNWITALTIDEPEIETNLSGFAGLDAQISKITVIDNPINHSETISLRYYGSKIIQLCEMPDEFTIQVLKNPSNTIGISLVIQDSNGWKISQMIDSNLSDLFTIDCSSTSISKAYLIISFINDQTPRERVDFGIGPITQISLFINQINSSKSTRMIEKSPFQGILIIILLAFLRRKERDRCLIS